MDINEALITGSPTAIAIAALLKNPDLLKLVYSDLASPSVKKVGEALSVVFGLGNTLLLPIKLLNDRTDVLFKNSMEKYRRKLEAIPVESVNKVAPEIGIPILEKLLYIQEEDLSDLYIELLANASNKSKCGYVHPLNIHILNMLTPDEAILLKNMSIAFKQTGFPYIKSINTIMRTQNDGTYRQLKENAIHKKYFNNIQGIDVESLYINNLITLGLINSEYTQAVIDKENEYIEIENELKTLYSDFMYISELGHTGQNLEYSKGYLKMTTTCECFLKSVNLL